MIITVEGLSGAGKSTLKESLAKHYGFTMYEASGFSDRSERMLAIEKHSPKELSLRKDRITHNIDKLWIARTSMLNLETENIIVDLFLERCNFIDQQEATLFAEYLMYKAPVMPVIGLVLCVDHHIRMLRLKQREGLTILPEFPNEDRSHRQSWEYLSKALPYPIRFINGNVSPQTVCQTAVSLIDKEILC